MIHSLRQTFEGTHTHWASPVWTSVPTNTVDNNTITNVHVLNLTGQDATVTVKFNDVNGVETHSITRSVRPRARETFEPDGFGGGWVEILSSAPVAPMGFVSKDVRSPHVQANQAIAFPMIFFPMVD